MFSFATPTVVERAVDALGVPLQDRALPDRREDRESTLIPNAGMEVSRQLHVLAIGEYLRELLVRSLEDAEGRVVRSVDDLDVLHGGSLAACRILRKLDGR